MVRVLHMPEMRHKHKDLRSYLQSTSVWFAVFIFVQKNPTLALTALHFGMHWHCTLAAGPIHPFVIFVNRHSIGRICLCLQTGFRAIHWSFVILPRDWNSKVCSECITKGMCRVNNILRFKRFGIHSDKWFDERAFIDVIRTKSISLCALTLLRCGLFLLLIRYIMYPAVVLKMNAWTKWLTFCKWHFRTRVL